MYPDAEILEISHRLLYRMDLAGRGDLMGRGPSDWLKELRRRARTGECIPSKGALRSQARRCGEQRIRVTWLGQATYPAALMRLQLPPPVLFHRGVLPPPQGDCMAIVGSRRASRAGLEFARNMGRATASLGLAVVSGLARGVDQAAQRGCLELGETWAVLGHGLDSVYPPEALRLAAEIAENGGLLSEFPPGVPPLPFHFPRRNRIIAGLCRALLVVEAGEKSGALSTATEALDIGLPLGVAPANPLNPSAVGSNRLLSEGAKPILGTEDLSLLLGEKRAEAASLRSWDPERCLREGVEDAETLAARSGWLLTETLSHLAAWEREGLLCCLAGGRFRVNAGEDIARENAAG